MTARPKTLEATFRSTTPTFMGGTDVRRTAEVRLSGIKGVLRFWWRAQAWMKWPDLDTIREKEAQIFGDINTQSPILLHLAPYQENSLPAGYRYELESTGNTQNGEGLLYLGQGLADRVSEAENQKVRRSARTTELRLKRACLPSQLMITLKILVRPCNEQAFIVEELEKALQLTGLFGGIGARTRRGFGSLTLVELKGFEKPWKAPETIDEMQSRLDELQLFGPTDLNIPENLEHAELPPFTAFSPRSRVVLVQGNAQERPLEVLDRLGKELIRYRSWGSKGKVLGGRAEKRFRKDHHTMLTAIRGNRTITMYPDRVIFGLPQSYFFSSIRAGAVVEPAGHGLGQGTDRRASPLLFHVHQSDENHPPIGVLTFLPAPFLAADESIKIGKHHRVKFKPEETNWKPIHGYLDRLKDASQLVEKFHTVREVRTPEIRTVKEV